MKSFALCLLGASALFAQTLPADLIEAARGGPAGPALKELLAKSTAATQVTVWGQDYLFVAKSPSPVTVAIDQQPAVPLAQVEGTDHWMLLTKMRTGVTHQYQFH